MEVGRNYKKAQKIHDRCMYSCSSKSDLTLTWWVRSVRALMGTRISSIFVSAHLSRMGIVYRISDKKLLEVMTGGYEGGFLLWRIYKTPSDNFTFRPSIWRQHWQLGEILFLCWRSITLTNKACSETIMLAEKLLILCTFFFVFLIWPIWLNLTQSYWNRFSKFHIATLNRFL